LNIFSSSLRTRILNDPYYRLQSIQEIQVAAALGVKIDVNQANVDDWLRLPGLSIHQARTLVKLTQSGVHFHCLDDIAAALTMPIQRLQPWQPVLNFCYYDPGSLATPCKINLNTASAEELRQIPGVDPALAIAFVQHRQQFGPYRNLVDFQRRLALPAALISELMHYLRF
jgi:DNA uptake protein ComE-like DNA-binding protein